MQTSSYSDTLITIAKLYYIGNLSQDEISRLMKLSRPKVSRMLKAARELKIVTFEITTPQSHYTHLEEQLCSLLDIGHATVVPSSAFKEITKQNVGKAAAQYLISRITDNCNIGITWGTTMSAMIRGLPQTSFQNCGVWLLSACLPSQQTDLDGHALVKQLAAKLNASRHILNAPFVLQNELIRRLLLAEPEIREHFQAFENLDIAVVGLGSSKPEESMTYLSKYITLEESKMLIDGGFSADICGHRMTKDAVRANTILSDRVLSISLDTLKKIPEVIAIASGEDKATSIIAGAKGKYINTLITDEIAALSVINTLK